jgi:flagellar hook assembly protein FlgD
MFVGGVEESNACDFKAAANLTIDPNPFREITTIKFQVPSTKSQTNINFQISLKIYDVSGKLVRSFNLASDFLSLASTFFWNGTDINGKRLPQGVYFVRLENESEALTEKVVLIK